MFGTVFIVFTFSIVYNNRKDEPQKFPHKKQRDQPEQDPIAELILRPTVLLKQKSFGF